MASSRTVAIAAARILEQRSHLVPGKLRITEHFFEVPRDHRQPDGPKLTLFARSARKFERPADESADAAKPLPWLLFLQGGPGFGCRPPQENAWTTTLLGRGYNILCLDQRGTGLSSPLSSTTLGLRGDDAVQAAHLKAFRADSIVHDCEAVRLALTADYPPDKKKWSIMGQSFGGFCCITYLSFYPDALKEAFLFGGLPPLVDDPDEVYARLYKRVAARNEAYYAKYPEDIERVKRIVGLLQRHGQNTVRLPSEGTLTARRFQQLGIDFGAHGGIDRVHGLVLRASADLDAVGHLTRPTLSAIEHSLSYDDHIIYSVLHEPLYCQGKPSNWSAHRVREQFSQFSLETDGPIYFTGEMIYPWMFDDYSELRKLKSVAELVNTSADWPALYDTAQLAQNTVPVYAAAYMDDMYVDFDLSMQTAQAIKGSKVFVTNMMYHDAVRSKMDQVLKGVMSLRDDVID